MAARIEKDGRFYRMRRGVLVEIPPEWVGQVTSARKIRQRPSKAIHKLRKALKYGALRGPRREDQRRDRETSQET